MRVQFSLARIAMCGFIGLGLAAGIAEAQPTTARSSKSVAAKKARLTELISNAFGAIWIDSDFEQADIEGYVREALDAGISPNVRDEFGETMLLQAVENLRLSTIRILLKRGANPNLAVLKEEVVRPRGLTPKMQAIYDAASSVGETPLMRVIAMDESFFHNKTDRLQIVRWLLERGANPNARNKAGNTALILAAMHGENISVPLLIKHGADLRMRGFQGQTALQVALAPSAPGSISIISGAFPDLSHAKTEQEKSRILNEHQKREELVARQERRRVSQRRAAIAKLLKAAGATR